MSRPTDRYFEERDEYEEKIAIRGIYCIHRWDALVLTGGASFTVSDHDEED